MQSKTWIVTSSIFSLIISLLLCSMKYPFARFPLSILFSTDGTSILSAVAHRPMARDSKMILVRKSFLSLNVLLVLKLAFGMRSPHADIASDSIFNLTLCSTGISVLITSSGLVGYFQSVSTSEPSICVVVFSFMSVGGSQYSSSASESWSVASIFVSISVGGSQYSSSSSDSWSVALLFVIFLLVRSLGAFLSTSFSFARPIIVRCSFS